MKKQFKLTDVLSTHAYNSVLKMLVFYLILKYQRKSVKGRVMC